jgi:hypothetical protein
MDGIVTRKDDDDGAVQISQLYLWNSSAMFLPLPPSTEFFFFFFTSHSHQPLRFFYFVGPIQFTSKGTLHQFNSETT